MGGSSAGGEKVTCLALVTKEARVLCFCLDRQLLSFDACLSFRLSILPATHSKTTTTGFYESL